jgi:hypothetical protein
MAAPVPQSEMVRRHGFELVLDWLVALGDVRPSSRQGYTRLRDHVCTVARLVAVGRFNRLSCQIKRCMNCVSDSLTWYYFRVWQANQEYAYALKYC